MDEISVSAIANIIPNVVIPGSLPLGSGTMISAF